MEPTYTLFIVFCERAVLMWVSSVNNYYISVRWNRMWEHSTVCGQSAHAYFIIFWLEG